MLIILNPELAAIDFESKKSNISEDYIQSRLEALGGRLQLSDRQPYTIFGKVSDMKGPPQSFRTWFLDFVEDEDKTRFSRQWNLYGLNEDDALRRSTNQHMILQRSDLLIQIHILQCRAPAAKIISLKMIHD